MSSEPRATPPHPLLLVHGIWDTGACFDAMREALENAGCGPVETIDLEPNNGSARIERLAEQVDDAARGLLRGAACGKLDLVGFSMGALVSRFWLQRLSGSALTRRFVSISGPHHGTVTAWAMPHAGVRQMRKNSQLLKELDDDDAPFGEVRVHTLRTPFDLMIVPSISSKLAHAHEDHVLKIPMHRLMITHPLAIERVVRILSDPE